VIVEFTSVIEASPEEVFAYHARPGALNRLLPPWDQQRLIRSSHSLVPGSQVEVEVRVAGWPTRIVARHEQLEPPHFFSDRQLAGPFRRWYHEHRFEAVPGDSHRTRLIDRIAYELPGGLIGQALGGSYARRKFDTTFAYRHRMTRLDLQLERQLRSVEGGSPGSRRVAVSGSHGLIGAGVVELLRVLGHQVIRLERPAATSVGRRSGVGRISVEDTAALSSTPWDPKAGLLQPEDLEGVDAVIHLAGAGIAERRWTPAFRRELWSSRVDATRRLAEQLQRLANPPRAFIAASAIGIYGHVPDREVEENWPASSDFLGQLATHWEQAADGLAEAGSRVAHGRLGIVLSPRGGALAKTLPLFRWGLGGRLGSGQQDWSWISQEDAVAALVWLAFHPLCRGPYNLAAGWVTNLEFTRALAEAVRRPACLPVPASLLRWGLGEMAGPLLLSSLRASSRRFLETGYRWRQPTLTSALGQMLGGERLTPSASGTERN
jgi:uncharacterized protein (TIGR01777 family)